MEWTAALYGAIEAGIRSDALAVCVAHKGAHTFYLDGCHALPKQRAPFTNPLPRCREDAACRLAHGTHVHAPPTRIEIDVESLAEAIVRASRSTRTERHQETTPAPRQAPPDAHESPSQPAPSIPTVTVWSPGMDDGTGG